MRSKKSLVLSTVNTWFICASCLMYASAAHAGFISGTHYTDEGKSVNLSNLEWLTWDLTNLSRNSVELRLANGAELEGFRYATRSEFEALLDSVWGGTHEGWHTSNNDGGSWLADTFHPQSEAYRYLYFGADGECSADTNMSCYGHYNSGWFQNDSGLSFGTSAINENAITDKSKQFASLAHVLVRDISPSAVSEPSALLLTLSGVLMLASFGRKCNGKSRQGH